MKRLLLLIITTVFWFQVSAQNRVAGTITDEKDQPVAGANVVIKGKVTGTVTDATGKFELSTSVQPPLTLVVSMVGYQRQEIEVKSDGETVSAKLVEATQVMDEMVFSASRVDESILESPVSIEKMDIRDIRTTPSMNFYDGLQNLKGVEMVTSGLTFNQINTRGFNSTGNSRFLQLVDGVDNQTPGLGFAVGNLFGSSDLDMESAELIPGAASALYGPVAFNGVLMMRTKDPFQYQGLSAQAKVGVNHIGETLTGPHALGDYSIRYAKAFNNKFAFKVNASYMSALDWYASNYNDVDVGTPEAQRGPNNPARNALNIYGDDEASEVQGVGRVSRTGYEERDLTDYNVYSLKLNGALHYRVSENATLSYQYNFGKGTANYTGSNRFSINNFTLQQHKVELKGANYFIRAYSTIEDSHDSYNAKGLGIALTKTWVQDMNGNVVAENKADSVWYKRYQDAFTDQVPGVTANSHAAARTFADQGRYLPGSPEFEAQKKRLIEKQGNGGAGILSQSKLHHIEGQWDLSNRVRVIDLLVGGNFRMYDMFTNGTLFDDKGKSIIIKEGGAFVQVGKKLANDRLKLSASMRYDKNQNFDGRITPRASAVYAVNKNHHFRASFQTGFRNPTPGDQYIKLNAGIITILGGVPDNSRDQTVYKNSFTTTSLGAFYPAFGAAMQQTNGNFPAAVNAAKDQLIVSDVDYIKPERVKVYEIGYKGLVFNNSLMIDANYYFNGYNDFLLNQVVIQPMSPVLGPDGKVNFDAAADILAPGFSRSHLYQLYTNASDRVTSQGGTLGLTYMMPRNYTLGGHVTYASFNLQNAKPEDIPAFNTPKYRTAVTFGNSRVTENFGFNIAWRWQDTYEWTSTFNQLRPGTINAFSVVDAQVSYKIMPIKSIIKIGGSNIFNNKVYQAFGSPSIGAIYYISLTFDELLR